MDPKALSNLDPKLRETYERVMGAAAPEKPAAATSAPTTATPPPAATPPPIPTPTASPVIDPGLSAPVAPTIPVSEGPFQTPVIPTSAPEPLPSPASINPEGVATSPVIRVLYIVGAIVFFIVYTYFWMKVFNLQLPF